MAKKIQRGQLYTWKCNHDWQEIAGDVFYKNYQCGKCGLKKQLAQSLENLRNVR